MGVPDAMKYIDRDVIPMIVKKRQEWFKALEHELREEARAVRAEADKPRLEADQLRVEKARKQ